jgi:metallophosphoesterase (TIGR00282 family)
MVGDVVGGPGLSVLERKLPAYIAGNGIAFTVVNGENAAGGFGITRAELDRILAAGADVVTSGNHVWEKRDFWPVLAADDRVLRPANYPAIADVPGRGWVRVIRDGVAFVVVNLQGREFMTAIDCPFRTFDALYEEFDGGVILVDFHAESSCEKEALGLYLDGRASVVSGTHTHVQTADEKILPGGTAYITDVGMTGVTDAVLGMDPGVCIQRAKKQVLYKMEPAEVDWEIKAGVQGVEVLFDLENKRAVSIKRIDL